MKFIGDRVLRREDPRLLTGRGRYVGTGRGLGYWIGHDCGRVINPTVVEDALATHSVRITRMPLTPTRLLELLTPSRGAC